MQTSERTLSARETDALASAVEVFGTQTFRQQLEKLGQVTDRLPRVSKEVTDPQNQCPPTESVLAYPGAGATLLWAAPEKPHSCFIHRGSTPTRRYRLSS